MPWEVQYYVPRPKTGNYDGKGSQSHYRTFMEEASAKRFAKNVVETGPAYFAIVKEEGNG